MRKSIQREAVRFASGDVECAAWHYPGTNGACVVMAGGMAVTKEPATDLFAGRFHDAGFSVLAFDYRGLGESGGEPRLVLPIRDQIADWQAAIGFARTLSGVAPDRIAAWAFSASAGHVLRAARVPGLAAAIAQTPYVGGAVASLRASRYQKPLTMLHLVGRSLSDLAGGLMGRPPRLVAVAGPRGTMAVLTMPDALDGDRALHAADHPGWQQKIAAGSVLRMAFYRPGRGTSLVRCPLLVLVCDQDQSTPAGPAVRAARRAPHAEIVRMPGSHYEPFLDGHEGAFQAQLSFLRRNVLKGD